MQTMDQGETVIRPSSKGGNLRLVLLANQGGETGKLPPSDNFKNILKVPKRL